MTEPVIGEIKIFEFFRLLREGQVYGTFSEWFFQGRKEGVAVELPWRNNEPFVSCIPAGSYFAELVDSPKRGKVYELIGVPGRENCQIHSANFGTLSDKNNDGKLEGDQLEGCIALGKEIAFFRKQKKKGITSSAETVAKFMHIAEGDKKIKIIIHPLA
jgi:hypothetical protein